MKCPQLIESNKWADAELAEEAKGLHKQEKTKPHTKQSDDQKKALLKVQEEVLALYKETGEEQSLIERLEKSNADIKGSLDSPMSLP